MELRFTVVSPVFLRVTVLGALLLPTTCGLNDRIRGVGLTSGLLATLKGSAPKAAHAAPLGKFSAKIWNPPGVARSVAVIATVILLALTNVEARNALLTNTRDPEVRPVPLSVSVKCPPPATATLGLVLVSVTGIAVVL